ncbi:plasmid mobilization protein [Algicella marina]|uniref:Uncharacterized protein n=1 Tax=Algicella marina TaxID=2683284 RepID=A0A6P1T0D7_9RHOB|nr:hypothetical protein [Algicella marina]QHQ35235.1 hypothetical protein GO499_08495 [Algicella marina]
MSSFHLEDTNNYIAETFNEQVCAKPPKKKRKRVAPVSVRLSEEERAILEEQAGGLSLSAHIRERMFGEETKPRKSRGRSPVKDHAKLAHVLRLLGETNLARDLSDLQWSVEEGQVCLSAKSEELLRLACVSVIQMRKDVLRALGLRA